MCCHRSLSRNRDDGKLALERNAGTTGVADRLPRSKRSDNRKPSQEYLEYKLESMLALGRKILVRRSK